MASFIVDTSQILSATTGADSVWIQSAGAGSSTVVGLAGNDTITFEGINNASSQGTVIKLGDGADTVTIQSATFSAGNVQIFAGDGADSVTISGGTIQELKLNEGNDLVIATGGSIFSAAYFSTGADNLRFSGTVDQLGMGNGNDIISGSVATVLTGGKITLGDGNDTMIITDMTGVSAVNIFGDNGTNFGADSMDFATSTGMNGLVVKGRGGDDTIQISGIQASALVQGNAGNDSVVLSAILPVGVEIGGGAGNDTIFLDGSGVGQTNSADIFGGLGNDSIFIDDVIAGSGQDSTAFNINGGAGSDTITFNHTLSGAINGEYGSIRLSSLSESTLTDMDFVRVLSGGNTLSTNAHSGGVGVFTVDFANSASVNTVGSTSAAADFDNATAYATMNASGVVTFAGTLATEVQSSVTAAMDAVDTLTLNNGGTGAAAWFTIQSEDYLFMQGGTAGRADDAIIKFSAGSATSIAANGSAIAFTFSGY